MVPLVSCIYLLGVFLGPLLTPIFFNIKRTIGICGKANAADAIICSKIKKKVHQSHFYPNKKVLLKSGRIQTRRVCV